MALNGAGELTTRSAGASWLPAFEFKKKTFTGTSDEGLGSVVVVVGGCRFNSPNGTLDGAMETGWI
jgi:hypothetical protein